MWLNRLVLLLSGTIFVAAKFEYLDPEKLQTKTSAQVQQDAATRIISKYLDDVSVEVIPLLFKNNKDVFVLWTFEGRLHIRASTGVAAVWGFNYYLKKYCNSQIAWQTKHVRIPYPLPEVDEVVVANDRFRFYLNVCTVSYSFVWWTSDQWLEHVEWMALNGINLVLAPVAQEAAWAKVYRQLGMTDDDIDDHFTGPAFLSWLRMGNMRGWGGPLHKTWHEAQRYIQDAVVDYMFRLGMIPVLPAFTGHVPRAFSRLYPNTSFFQSEPWNKFGNDYCCGLFINPEDALFKTVGKMYLKELTAGSMLSNIYIADSFNEVKIQPWSTEFVENTARAIYSTLVNTDPDAVMVLQNWMIIDNPVQWPADRVKAYLTSIPLGRMLVLDLQSEQWPQYDLHEMYYGQPFIWCMLHNFGGTSGMFGSIPTINTEVHKTRSRTNSMIGIGLTPEGINQNYIVYDFMLETAWRKTPVESLNDWVNQYAKRRYGCNNTAKAWKYLLNSVYSFNGLNKMRGKYVVTRRPSFKIKPWAWYKGHDLFEAFKIFAFVNENVCDTDGFTHDLVDVTRQALQYRAEQLYQNLLVDRFSNSWVFNVSINQFLNSMEDMEEIVATHTSFTAGKWFESARSFANTPEEVYLYELNARNQITLWGPNGEISDYASKQWAELFHYYYIPRWSMFLTAALVAKVRNEVFDERNTQKTVKATIEEQFQSIHIASLRKGDPREIALALYEKWANVPDLKDLPTNIIHPELNTKSTTLPGMKTNLSVSEKPFSINTPIIDATTKPYVVSIEYEDISTDLDVTRTLDTKLQDLSTNIPYISTTIPYSNTSLPDINSSTSNTNSAASNTEFVASDMISDVSDVNATFPDINTTAV